MTGWEQLLGVPWRLVSCIGLINLLGHLPCTEGDKWGRVRALRYVPWDQRKDGDLIVWHEVRQDRYVVLGHVGILINAGENYLLHSGTSGRLKGDWRTTASVSLIQLPHPTGAVLRP